MAQASEADVVQGDPTWNVETVLPPIDFQVRVAHRTLESCLKKSNKPTAGAAVLIPIRGGVSGAERAIPSRGRI
jgi:hypothetical protein